MVEAPGATKFRQRFPVGDLDGSPLRIQFPIAHLNIHSILKDTAPMFPDFFGNADAAAALDALTRERRMPQTILLDGPEEIGKATLARRFGAVMLGGGDKIEQDDLFHLTLL